MIPYYLYAKPREIIYTGNTGAGLSGGGDHIYLKKYFYGAEILKISILQKISKKIIMPELFSEKSVKF